MKCTNYPLGTYLEVPGADVLRSVFVVPDHDPVLKCTPIEYQVSAGRSTSGFRLRDTSNQGLGCREVSRSSDILKYH